MPCYDGSPSWANNCYDCTSLKKRLDKVTRLACTLLKEGAPCPKEFASWWAAHQKADMARGLKEADVKRKKSLKRAALKKLSKEEKDLLGL